MAEFRMPSLGADMESGILTQWLVKPGDRVERGDVVAVVETQKGAIDIETFESGTVSRLLVAEGATVPVGTVMALLNGAATPPRPPAPAPERAAPEVAAPAQLVASPAAPNGAAPAARPGRVRASPLARRRAAELGLDLTRIVGSRPCGAISAGDIERAAAAATVLAPAAMPAPTVVAATVSVPAPPTVPAPPPAAPEPLVVSVPAAVAPAALVTPAAPASEADRQAAMRAAIAAAMSRANREIPHYYLGTEIDMSRALAWLEATNQKRPVPERLLYAVLLLKSVALALHEVPELNGFYTEAGFQPSEAIHVGVAISLRWGGLVAPAIHDADTLGLDELMARLRDLIQRARSGKLRSSELADPTITVTNLGEQGVPTVYGVIYPPQVALVGFGRITERPWAVDGMLAVRPVLTATLAADHRASDGHRGGRFLAAIDRLLQEPDKL
jgi:pyruvate dehydrogenase E2 component (dihydrolipoamide acetyltransferase)